jgi:2-polyprenyl-6-methoxyphenol hydroxylase-like FAD-dependent oxidoreductase
VICAEGSHSSIRHTLNLDFKGKSLEQSYALADLHIDGELPEDSLSIFVVERGFLGLFPMGQRRFRMISTDPQHQAVSASDPSLAEMQRLYDAHCHIREVLHDVAWTSRFRVNSRMLHSFRSGRVFFGGDSAHVHSPAGGQGMNTGIQDMINLCWKLALVYRGHAQNALLDPYTEERHPVIDRLLNTTEKATDAMNSQGRIAHQIMTHVAPLVLDSKRARELGSRILSQVKFEYRSSSLSHTLSV